MNKNSPSPSEVFNNMFGSSEKAENNAVSGKDKTSAVKPQPVQDDYDRKKPVSTRVYLTPEILTALKLKCVYDGKNMSYHARKALCEYLGIEFVE